MSTPRRITAAAPLSMLVAALSRVQWGPLAGAKNRPAQLILLALGSHAQYSGLDSAGEITITTHQLADMAGYSDRHLRRWMPVLEGLGLIQWRRGGVIDGKPQPGTLRVCKKLLAQWVRDWTARADAAIEARRIKTLARLKGLRLLRIPPYRPRWKAHADTLASPPPSTRGEQGDSAPRPLPPAGDSTPEKKENPDMLAYEPYLAVLCNHGTNPHADPTRCNRCRYEAIQRHQEAKKQEAAERAQLAETPTPYEAYMRATYPDVHPLKWYTIAKSDPRAKELLHATA